MKQNTGSWTLNEAVQVHYQEDYVLRIECQGKVRGNGFSFFPLTSVRQKGRFRPNESKQRNDIADEPEG